MPMRMPEGMDPNDPAEQGYSGERDQPREREGASRPQPDAPGPVIWDRDDDEDEQQSER